VLLVPFRAMHPVPPTAHILVVGAGYVGLVTGVGLASQGHDVSIVETRADRYDALSAGRVPIFEAGLQDAFEAAMAAGRLHVLSEPGGEPDLVMVCVGTPIGADGRSDLSQLRTALHDLHDVLAGDAPLVIRSTLPPGATRQAVAWAGIPTSRVLTNPEFLRQGTALADFLQPTRVVIGHFPDADPAVVARVAGLYERFGARILVMDVAASEIAKNGANAFLALKLSFANEIASISEEFGTDVDQILEAITLDPRIGNLYMRPGLGFGGSCLPKELRALAVAGMDRGLPMLVTNAASEANVVQQARFAGRIEQLLGGLPGRTVGLLGLAFKAGTDDVRDSPPLAVARTLLAGGATVVAHDPQAGPNALRELPGLRLADDPMGALDGADVAVIGTEWPLYRDIDWAAAAERMHQPAIVDGRRLLDGATMRALGYRYETVGSGYEASVDEAAAAPLA
jgi:UDPglucose 6-dehydrogenase